MPISRMNKDVDYFTEVFPGVCWVPYSYLGATRFSDQEIINLSKLYSISNIVSKLRNPFELIQLLHTCNFCASDDKKRSDENSWIYEEYAKGDSVLRDRSGGCATYSGFFYGFCKERGIKSRNIIMLTNIGTGHALNCIYLNSEIYICDLYAQLNEFSDYIPRESGVKRDFIFAKYKTGACLKVGAISDFVNLITNYNRLSSKKFLFLSCQTTDLPPMKTSICSSHIKVWLRPSDKWSVENKVCNCFQIIFKEF